MIEDIKVAKAASYDADGVQISGLQKINFFYGANGCGKTTISNLLADPQGSDFNHCEINWKNDYPLKTLAYNKAFRDKNFGTGNIAGVFTLGEATKEDLELIEQKRTELKNLNDQQSQQTTTLKTQEDALTEHITQFTDKCWTLYKKHESQFKDALKGSIGSKVAFKDKLLSEAHSNSSPVESFDSLQEKAKTLLGTPPSPMSLLPTFNRTETEAIEQNPIWQKVIVGKTDVDIAGMIGKLDNSDWVNQGRQYLGEDDRCPFCQQPTIDKKFRQQLEEYFDETFEQEKAQLTALQQRYERAWTDIHQTLVRIETTEKSDPQSKLAIESFSARLRGLESRFSENLSLIKEKQEKTSHKTELKDTQGELAEISSLIEQANAAIKAHNEIVDNFDQKLIAFKQSVWRYLVEEFSSEIDAHKKTANNLQKGIEGINRSLTTRSTAIRALDAEIKGLSKNVTSIQPTIDEINRTLRAYGFTNFEIVPSTDLANHYTIQRESGESAHHTLSEGEITFITFLYFVQLAKGATDQDSVTDERVLVIDDPISSLDSNVLYVVSSIIKGLIKDIKEDRGSIRQMLLLTHNVYFHKEASFQNGRSNGDKDTHFWIIRKDQNVTSIQPYEQQNPIESSYELLWREIKDRKNNSCITLQNTMRRIIEAYFKILGKWGDDDLISSFDIPEEKQICRSLLCWINDGSHTIPDDLFVQPSDDSPDRYLAVFEKIFEYTNNHGHYLMMMGETV